MKKLLVAICALAVSTLAFAADPAEGYWISVDEKSGKETAGWQVYEENGRLYGKILSAAGVSADAKADKAKGKSYKNFMNGTDIGSLNVIGTTWIWDLRRDEPGEWEDGYIIDPNDGKRYRCEIEFHRADGKKYKEDTLEMEGKVGPIGRSQYWKKADESQAKGLR